MFKLVFHQRLLQKEDAEALMNLNLLEKLN
jgi:hypothetical protein